MFFWNTQYMLFAIPGLLLALWAQAMVKGTFARYARVPTSTGISGAQVAQLLMQRTGLHLAVNNIPGSLTDFYNPSNKSINLSQTSVQPSVASVAVVAHEIGHAVQDAQGYVPMRLRGAMVPAVSLGGWVGPLLFIAGWFLSNLNLVWGGIILFGASVVFALLTLPVELNASSRAMQLLTTNGVLVSQQEVEGARKVLNAAAFTYVAAAAQALLTLLYYLSLVTGRRR
ncbi:MAG TPA: zinc metallopeptidase [Candidatus Acidoferrales bacterium]|nr:zinc metallopeptidase [Candidatus Acidoferrales bacterium]